MSRRIAVNLVSFLLLATLLTVWAARNYITFGLTEPPSYEVGFTFSSSPGLRPGFDVAYLGVPIGSITRVELDGEQVAVTADVRSEHDVTADVVASIRRRSAVGEPFIDLAPKPDADLDGPPRLRERPTVALADTRLPLSYEEVFSSVSELLDAIPADAVSTITEELAIGLEGREDDLVTAVRDFESVAVTLGARAELFDELAVRSSELSGFVAGEAGQLSALTVDLELLAAQLRRSRDDLTTLLDETPGTLDRAASMLTASRPAASCLFDAVRRLLDEVDTPANETALRDALADKDALLALLEDVTHERDGGLYLRVDAFVNDGEDLRTGTRTQPPAPPALTDCGELEPSAEPGAGPAASTAALPEPLPAATFDDDTTEPPTGDRDGVDADTPVPTTTDRRFPANDVSPLVLLLPLGLAGLVAWRPWRRRR